MASTNMSIERAHIELGWPDPSEVWNPSGSGPRVYATLADRKIGDTLRRLEGSSDIRLGVIVPDSSESSSQQPLAIVCEFQSPATSRALHEAHRLAWNFSRAPLLITLEPHLIRAWSCCEAPSPRLSPHDLEAEIVEARFELGEQSSLSARAAQSLHWLELVTGNFFRRYENRFKRDGCADRLLLDNLKYVRQELLGQGLSDDISHDLLARLIFIQFLFDRKDSSGSSALNAAKLKALHKDGVLKTQHDTLESVLRDYRDAYALFRWLDTIFNGDLFPGKGDTKSQCEAGWAREMAEVTPRHLETIASFVSGSVELKSKQRLLWKEYSFDAIPLEFISSIYEEFVTKVKKKKTGAVYTPPYVVDFVLDEVLPWERDDWDIRVLDPSCGSGIFLVKAFQRLVHRWRLAHPGQEPKATDLRLLLERNLFGVDIDPHAIRVASFSLYLAMCDEIDPRHYWTQVRFPQLRGRSLVCSDFFAEDKPGFRSDEDAGAFDIVVGNAPWGQNTIGTSDISRWNNAGWPAVYKSIGPVFLAKSSAILKPGGRLSMLEPAGLILNDVGTAKAFRQKLFTTVAVESIVNLAALRFVLFPSAVGPACIVTFRNESPIDKELAYICPKPTDATDNNYRIVVEPYDIHVVSIHDVVERSLWWIALMWGGRRDVALIERLNERRTIKMAVDSLRTREGIIRGNQKRAVSDLLGRRILEQPNFPDGTWLRLQARDLPKNGNPRTHDKDSTDFSAFEPAQLLIKQSWTVQKGHFEAALVDSEASVGGVICTQSYITVHVPPGNERVLEAACLTCNSILAVYFLFLTSSRLAAYRPEPLVKDWLRIPIPTPSDGILDGLHTQSDVDHRLFERLELTPTDRVLVEDAVSITLADFKGYESSPGRRTTRSAKSSVSPGPEPILTRYCEQFLRALHVAFGGDKQVRATIFQDRVENELAVRLVAFHLNWPTEGNIVTEAMEADLLYERLRKIGERFCEDRARTGFQRIARIYDVQTIDGHVVPIIYLVKPDRVRYWTRSVALRDADEVIVDFMLPSDSELLAEKLEYPNA